LPSSAGAGAAGERAGFSFAMPAPFIFICDTICEKKSFFNIVKRIFKAPPLFTIFTTIFYDGAVN
jgi:hypothetical protein